MKYTASALLFCIVSCTTLCMDQHVQRYDHHHEQRADQDIVDCLSACRVCDKEVVARLLARGVNPNTRLFPPLVPDGYEDTTFLHWSTQSPEITEVLIRSGALVNAQDEERRTPLHFAACSTKPKTVEVLLAHGADPKHTDLGGNNPLHEITRCAAQGFLGWRLSDHEKIQRGCKVIELLKEKGAPLFLQNKALETPFHYAATCHNAIVVSLFMPVHAQESPYGVRTAAKRRLCAFLCTLRRLNAHLPEEVVLRIFSYAPLECKHAGIVEKIVPYFMNKEDFKTACVKEIMNQEDVIAYLKQVMPEDDRAVLKQALLTPNVRRLIPQQLANVPSVQQLFDPAIWNKEKGCNHG